MACCKSCEQGLPCEGNKPTYQENPCDKCSKRYQSNPCGPCSRGYRDNPAPAWFGWTLGAFFATALFGGTAAAVIAHRRKQAALALQQQASAIPPPPPDPKRSLAPFVTRQEKLLRQGVQTLAHSAQKSMSLGTQLSKTSVTLFGGTNPFVITLSQEEASARSVLDSLKKDGSPLSDMRARTIYINTWQDVDELVAMMQTLLLHALKPTKEGAEMAQFVRSFFLRNRWAVRQDSEVYQDQLTVLNYLTPPEGREVIDAAMVVREAAWAGEVATSNDYIKETTGYIQHLGCIPKFYPTLTNEARAKVPHVLADGLLLIYEHALVKTGNMLAVMSANPKAVPGLEAKLLAVATPLLIAAGKVAAAAVIGGAAAASAAVPVVGWITAAVGAVAAGVAALFDLIGSLNKREEANLAWQQTLQNAAEDLWTKGLSRRPLRESLLGYQLGLISDDPSYTEAESRARQPWLRNFCLVRGDSWGSPCAERIFPQIPLLVRQIKQGAVVQFGIGRDALRTVSLPWKAWMAPNKQLLMGWQIADIAFEDLPKNIKYLGVV